MKSIQSKILLVVISALMVIMVIVTTIAVSVAHDIIHRDADRILRNVTLKEAAQINGMLDSFVKSSAIMEHYALSELDEIASLEDPEEMRRYSGKVRNMFNEVALNTDGAKAFYLCYAPEFAEHAPGFFVTMRGDSLYKLSDEEFARLSLVTPEQAEEYAGMLRGSIGMWMEPHPSQFSQVPVISYVVPIFHGEMFVGVLGFNMEFDFILERVNRISVYEYGYAVLLSADQSACYNPDRITHLEDECADAYAPLSNDMVLELRAPYRDIQAGIRPMLTYIVLAFCSVLITAIGYTILVTRNIVAPLKKLTASAAAITSGEQNVSFDVDSKDEIGILARALSDSYERIRGYSAYINALAYRDSLTGVRNSTAYAQAAAELDKEINLGSARFGVLVADANNLKKINDTYGHDIGNELIIHVAKILTGTFMESSIYRIGGDEFVVILRGHDLEQYHTLLEKMDAALASDRLMLRGEAVPISAARGVARFDPAVDCVYHDVFVKADHAMYLNKIAAKSSRSDASDSQA